MASKAKRSFGLSEQDIQELAAQYAETKQFPNPYRAGAYKFTIDALVKLGANKAHPLAKVYAAFKAVAGREWFTAWAGAEKRNPETGEDADERFLTNLRVLQRTSDYAMKLLQVGREVLKSKGAVIDLTRDDKGRLLVALNLDSDAPLKPGRSEKSKKPTRKAGKGSQTHPGELDGAGADRKPTPKGKKPRTAGKAK